LLFVNYNGKPVCGTANLVYIPNFIQMGEKAVIRKLSDEHNNNNYYYYYYFQRLGFYYLGFCYVRYFH